jgi:hypothetical protein
MRAKVRDALSGHRSRLSIRRVAEGRYVYEIDGHRHALTSENFLLVNPAGDAVTPFSFL